MDYVLVGVGGALGSIARYSLGRLISAKTKCKLPLGTFIINMTGAFLLGVVCSIINNTSWYLFLADGFLGAYTTFSTVMYEDFNFFKDNDKLNAFTYILASFIIGMLCFGLGYKIRVSS